MKSLSLNNRNAANISDNNVIRRILSGEKELFEILLRRYNQTLYRVVRSYLRSEDDVEDTMQNTYIKAYQKLAQFSGHSSFPTWLIRVGINEALQTIRKTSRTYHSKDYNGAMDKFSQLPDTNNMNPEKHMIKHEISQLVEQAIDRLPDRYRIIFMLHDVEGLKNSEIAECLNLSESNVKVRLHRAKNMLKEEFYKLSSDASIFEFGNNRCDQMVNYVMNKI